jgi:hypothetical protein
LATDLSRLATVHGQIPKVTEIERSELRFGNRLLISLMSRRIDYGHGQDVGIEVHIFVFFLLLVLVDNTELTLLDTAILLSVSTGSSAFTALGSPFAIYSIVKLAKAGPFRWRRLSSEAEAALTNE